MLTRPRQNLGGTGLDQKHDEDEPSAWKRGSPYRKARQFPAMVDKTERVSTFFRQAAHEWEILAEGTMINPESSTSPKATS